MCSRKRVKSESLPDIPDDVIICNIISRLPTKDVCRYRCVRKSWNDVTTTISFQELHLQHARTDLLVLDINNRYTISPFLLSKWWDLDHLLKPTIHRLTNYPKDGIISVHDGFSHDGLIVLKETNYSDQTSRDFIMFNPIYGQEVRVRLPPKFMVLSDIYGAFFHPISKEYCTLWRVVEQPNMNSSESIRVKYKLLNLGPEPRWREINNPWSHYLSMVYSTSTVYANGAIYWMVNGNQTSLRYIMVYEIITETFALIPCPSELGMARTFSLHIQLLNIDGLPSVVQIQEIQWSVLHVCIWTLRNNGEPFWTLSTYFAVGDGKKLDVEYILRPIAVVDGVLAFHNQKRIFLCSLRKGTITIYGRGKYNRYVTFWSHVASLLSLNCRPIINMEEDIAREQITP